MDCRNSRLALIRIIFVERKKVEDIRVKESVVWAIWINRFCENEIHIERIRQIRVGEEIR